MEFETVRTRVFLRQPLENFAGRVVQFLTIIFRINSLFPNFCLKGQGEKEKISHCFSQEKWLWKIKVKEFDSSNAATMLQQRLRPHLVWATRAKKALPSPLNQNKTAFSPPPPPPPPPPPSPPSPPSPPIHQWITKLVVIYLFSKILFFVSFGIDFSELIFPNKKKPIVYVVITAAARCCRCGRDRSQWHSSAWFICFDPFSGEWRFSEGFSGGSFLIGCDTSGGVSVASNAWRHDAVISRDSCSIPLRIPCRTMMPEGMLARFFWRISLQSLWIYDLIRLRRFCFNAPSLMSLYIEPFLEDAWRMLGGCSSRVDYSGQHSIVGCLEIVEGYSTRKWLSLLPLTFVACHKPVLCVCVCACVCVCECVWVSVSPSFFPSIPLRWEKKKKEKTSRIKYYQVKQVSVENSLHFRPDYPFKRKHSCHGRFLQPQFSLWPLSLVGRAGNLVAEPISPRVGRGQSVSATHGMRIFRFNPWERHPIGLHNPAARLCRG